MLGMNYGGLRSVLGLSTLVLVHGTFYTYFDRMLPIGLAGNFGALKVNAVRGSSMFKGLALIS